MTFRASSIFFAAAAALALVASCMDTAGDGSDEFVAMQRDFSGFPEWPHASLGVVPTMPGHPGGSLTIYINHGQPPAPQPFPTGTIIVKVSDGDDTVAPFILAMAKRGGDYNAEGAIGWEWFELKFDDNAEPVIVWRGEDAPDGECYGCLPGDDPMAEPTSCNDCHGASEQDSVYSRDQLP